MKRLEKLRRRVAQLDSALLHLVAERMELAREIGEEKLVAQIPLRDFAVEREVLERARKEAFQLGLDPDLAEQLLGQLMSGACQVQESARAGLRPSRGEQILVVGGAGRMGRWLVRFLENQGHSVSVWDRDPSQRSLSGGRSLEQGLERADLVLLAVPIDEAPSTIEKIVAAEYRGTLADLASVKDPLRPALQLAGKRGCRVASFHPMFGPDVRTLADRVIVLCDCGDREGLEAIRRLFSDTAAELVTMPIDRHDETMAYVLGLAHLVNLCFARALAGSGLSYSSLQAVRSSTFSRQAEAARAVISENPELYWSIQSLNPYTRLMLEGIRRSLSDWVGWIESGSSRMFLSGMEEGRSYFEETGRPEHLRT